MSTKPSQFRIANATFRSHLGVPVSQRPLFDPARTRAVQTAADKVPPRLLSVSQLNAMVRAALTAQLPGTLHVVAELGDVSRPGSGHLYFTLKDAHSELRCVMWKSSAGRLRFEPQTGLEVVATGQLEVYEPRGFYQLVVRSLEPRGTGALELALRQLREKLEREGLLAPARKRPLPRFPFRIALVTSPGGAAIRDVLRTLSRRFPIGHVVLFPARVQGDGAATEIADAIARANRMADALGGIDVMILARGGGSLEDLWAFNEESVARAIAASAIPIVTGVGHEIDVTISDLVADLRAPTPTAAAELATPLLGDLLATLDASARHAWRAASVSLERGEARLARAAAGDLLAQPLRRSAHARQRLDDALRALSGGTHLALCARRDALRDLEAACGRLAGVQRVLTLHRRLDAAAGAARWVAARRCAAGERRLAALVARLERLPPRLASSRGRFDQAASRLAEAVAHRFSRLRRDLDVRQACLHACDPRAVLRRGYSIVRDRRGPRVIRSVQDVRDGMPLEIEVADGRFTGTADDPRQPRLF